MPDRPLRPCPVPGCPNLVRTGRCELHGGPEPAHRWDTDRRQDVKRTRGRANQERRVRLFRREPLCRQCAAEGRTTLATIADHVVPLAEGGADDESNLAPICGACHQKKIAEESRRGRLRG